MREDLGDLFKRVQDLNVKQEEENEVRWLDSIVIVSDFAQYPGPPDYWLQDWWSVHQVHWHQTVCWIQVKNNININVLVVTANSILTLHRLMADGHSATYILNEEKNEERRREEKQKDGSGEGNRKKSVKRSKSFKKIIPPPGVPKQKAVNN